MKVEKGVRERLETMRQAFEALHTCATDLRNEGEIKGEVDEFLMLAQACAGEGVAAASAAMERI